ncbi:MAG: GspE/PulE family protein, partial [Pseudomonadota bacterium]
MTLAVTIHRQEPDVPDRFLADGTLTEADLARVREVAATTMQPVRLVLDRLGIVSQRRWAEAVAEETGLPVIGPDDFPNILPQSDTLSPDYMRANGFALLKADEDGARVAVADPTAAELRHVLRMVFGAGLSFSVASDRDIEAALDRSEAAAAPDAEAVLPDGLDGDLDADRLTELANNAPTVKYVDWIFTKAVESGATDIHMEPFEGGPRVRLRIDGVLVSVDPVERHLYEGVISRLKILAGMDISERRLPQDGRIRQKAAGRAVDIRVASAPTVHGETMVMRLLDGDDSHARLGKLDLPSDIDQALRAALRHPHGLILMTGPTGSGKTTTLHAALAELNEEGRKVITIENPVEIQNPGLIQIEVKPELGLSFAAALRTVLRHDPEVLMVGEIRDAETAELAIRAAMTGHLVLSTLHTNRAAEAPLRLADMGVPDYLIAQVLRLVGA